MNGFCPDPDPEAPFRELAEEASRLGYRLAGPEEMSIRELQDQIWPWSKHNFGDEARCSAEIAALGLGEETGEVQRALIKRYEGIRGSYDEWTRELEKELGDVFIKLCDVASRAHLNLEECIMNRWNDVRQRDFQADPIGHGMPHPREGRHHTGTGDIA